jgi:hypothetical protein
MFHLAVCAIFKNEASYLAEWVDFHTRQGVEHFFLYDNESTDDYKAVLGNNCTVIDWPGKARQVHAYNHFSEQKKAAWAAFIDIDEFLFSPSGQKLPEILKAYQDCDGVGANWRMYGPCGHKTRPAGLVWDSYTTPTPESDSTNRHVKSIVRLDKVVCWLDPHIAKLLPGSRYVDENKTPLYNALTETYSGRILRINHYFTKSEEECRIKAERGRADIDSKRRVEDMLRAYQEKI